MNYYKINAIAAAALSVGAMLLFDVTGTIDSSHIQVSLEPSVAVIWLLMVCALSAHYFLSPPITFDGSPTRARLISSLVIDAFVFMFLIGVGSFLLALICESFYLQQLTWTIDRDFDPTRDSILRWALFFVIILAWMTPGMFLFLEKPTIGGAITNTYIKLERPSSFLACAILGPTVFFEVGTLVLPEYLSRQFEVSVHRVGA